MKLHIKALIGTTLVGITMLAPSVSFADSRQDNKNTGRNIGIAGAVVAGYGLIHHDPLTTILGAAAAVVGGTQYESARASQSRDNSRWYHRDYSNNWRSQGDNNNGGYGSVFGNDNRSRNYNNNNSGYANRFGGDNRSRNYDNNNRSFGNGERHNNGGDNSYQSGRFFRGNSEQRDRDDRNGGRDR